jgi:hypothetical protein
LRYNVIRYESKELYEKNIYKEAARRVVFQNCMTACEIDPKTVPNFNKNFYYNQIHEQNDLQECYNTRMKLHFGSQAEKEGMLLDFAAMKREYQRYEKWNPKNRLKEEYLMNHDDSYINKIT